jgi:Amt family ammonium transporter
MCTAVSLLTWTLLDIIFFKKPAVVGAIQGMITGLVAITPAAGTFFYPLFYLFEPIF